MTAIRNFELSTSFIFDIFLRFSLAVIFLQLEIAEPFQRKIHEDELWLYKNPRIDSYVPTTVLWPLIFLLPPLVIFIIFLLFKDKTDLYQALLCITLALGLNGVITDIIKLIVGRPRPDFFWRCFPDGIYNKEFRCTGNAVIIRDGRKSFPSGHSSFAFTSFGFIALYLAGKFHTFSLKGKGNSFKLCAFIFPIGVALVIALSRTCDYHHHWQDVMVGSVVGFLITYICYQHYYPPLNTYKCHKPICTLVLQMQSENSNKYEQIKWI